MNTPPPREGLPPCVTVAFYDGRRACMIDASLCDIGSSGHHMSTRFYVNAGHDEGPLAIDIHSEFPLVGYGVSGGFSIVTDDPAEAEAAFERGERWVRTGELDD